MMKRIIAKMFPSKIDTVSEEYKQRRAQEIEWEEKMLRERRGEILGRLRFEAQVVRQRQRGRSGQ